MNKSILLLAAIITLAGCAKDKTAPGSGYTGKVLLTNEFGQPQADQSGVLVTVTDVMPQVTTQTAADGTYTLANVPDGSHSITFSKTGYGTFLTGGLTTDPHQIAPLNTYTLGQLATAIVTLRTGSYKNKEFYLINGSVSPLPTATQPRPHRLFLQDYNQNLIAPPLATGYGLSLRGYTRSDGTFTDTVTIAQLAAANFISGNGNEVKIWGTGDNLSASVYQDVISGKTVFPAANLVDNPKATFFYFSY